ncbi:MULTISPECIES: hypothetical protein [Streptomyces]|nr:MULTISPECIES: hypothetical protein [Streptomyces]
MQTALFQADTNRALAVGMTSFRPEAAGAGRYVSVLERAPT